MDDLRTLMALGELTIVWPQRAFHQAWLVKCGSLEMPRDELMSYIPQSGL